MTATCAICGTPHEEDELELSYSRPDAVFGMTSDERSSHAYESDDICTIEGRFHDDGTPEKNAFFLRATLPLRVTGRKGEYHIGVWVEVSEDDFHRVGDLWRDPEQAAEPPMSVTIANEVRHHPGSLGARALLQLTGAATRPQVFVADPQFSLGNEQRRGITAHRASEYSAGLTSAV